MIFISISFVIIIINRSHVYLLMNTYSNIITFLLSFMLNAANYEVKESDEVRILCPLKCI